MVDPSWVLYVAHATKTSAFTDACALCMRILDEREDLNDVVVVQDCDALRARNVLFPDWLLGTPKLVERDSLTVYAGSDAIVKLACLVVEAPRQRFDPIARATNGGTDAEVAHRGNARDVMSSQPPVAAMRASPNMSVPPAASAQANVWSDDGDDDDDGDSLQVRNIVKNPPVDDSNSRRIGENDVASFLAERKRADATLRARLGEGAAS